MKAFRKTSWMHDDPDSLNLGPPVEGHTPWTAFASEIYPALRVFALRQLKFLGDAGFPIPADCTAEDCVHEAVRKTRDGSRRWKPEQCNLKQHLFGAVRSEISNRVSSYENLHVFSWDEQKIMFSPAGITEMTPEGILINKQSFEILFTYLDKIDPQLGHLAASMLFSPIKDSSSYAKSLDITVHELYKLRKRLGRALLNLVGNKDHSDD